MALSKQMEMFEDGGLKDEGGMTDEVSGNDVPSGSTREEVRDDIPAQLSEGEFVFPADVVRYIGLEKLMMMRQEAKQGLKQMEAMGQMGNSDEATMADDLPFDETDLDIEDDLEYNRGGVIEAQQGTYVAPTIPIGRQPLGTNPMGNPTQIMPQQVASGVSGASRGTPYVPNVGKMYGAGATPYAPVSYQDFLGPSAGGAPKTESVRYFNEATGQTRMIPHIINADGSRGATLYPIPEGFVIQEEAPKEEAKKSQVASAKVKPVDTGNDSSDQEEREREEAMYGRGAGRISLGGEIVDKTRMVGTGVKSRQLKGSVVGSTTFGIGYNLPGGRIPGATFIQAINAGLGNIPKGGTAKFTLNGISIVKDAEVANSIIKNPRGDDAKNLIAEHKISRELETKHGLSKKEINSILEANYNTKDGRKEIDANLSTEAQEKLIDAVIAESKADDGSVDMNKFNSLPDAVQESYYQAADDRQEGGVDIPDSNISQPSDNNQEDFSDYSDDNNDSGGGYDSDNSSGFGADSDTDSGDYEATGGLLTKRKASGKLKNKYKKKMKRGGLASR